MATKKRALIVKRYKDIDLARGMRVVGGIEGRIEVSVSYRGTRRWTTFPQHAPLTERIAWQHAMLEGLRLEATYGPQEDRTLREDIDIYLESLSPGQRRRAAHWLAYWTQWFGHLKRDELELQQVQAFFQHVAQKNKPGVPFGASSKNLMRTYLIAVYRYFDGRRHACPASEVPLFEEPHPKTREIDPVLIERILAKMADTPNRARLGLLYVTGMRPAELLLLRRANFVFDEHPRVQVIGAKGGKDRVVPLPPAGVTYARAFIRHEGWRTLCSLGRDMKRVAKRLGIPTDSITPYALRHAYGMNLSRAGADLKDIADLLGHKELQTSTRYVHPTPERTREVAGRMWASVNSRKAPCTNASNP